jgi:hypothetical protein
MSDLTFKDKFIAFIDVLGFTTMVEAAEKGMGGRSVSEICEILSELGREKSKEFIRTSGPSFCPLSVYIEKDLDFQVSQVSDCAIVSCEISPAGVINLFGHCWGAVAKLLTEGVMVRGYIKRGSIFHNEKHFFGTGYHDAYEHERAKISAFKREAEERGTPFIEVDPDVCDYIRYQTDPCVVKLFERFVKTEDGLTALFPFQRLVYSPNSGAFGDHMFDPAEEKNNNDTMRTIIMSYKEKLLRHVDHDNKKARAPDVHSYT